MITVRNEIRGEIEDGIRKKTNDEFKENIIGTELGVDTERGVNQITTPLYDEIY